jgi:DNA polymerase
LHKRPGRTEITACRPWLTAELHAVRPGLVVCLGSVAASSLLGADFRVTERHGEIVELDEVARQAFPDGDAPPALATTHPSAVLRATDRDAAFDALVADLGIAARACPTG